MANRIFKESPWGEYEVVGLKVGWTGMTYILLILALLAPTLMQYLPWRPQNRYFWPLIVSSAVPSLALLGAASALVGLRRTNTPIPLRVGLVLNGVTALISSLTVFGMIYLFTR